jgi:hypothetical protein
MISERKLKKMVIATAVFVLALSSATVARAQAHLPYAHMSLTHCTVNSGQWGVDSGKHEKLMLPRAVIHANEGPTSAYYACGEQIGLAIDVIGMKGPLIIQADGSSSVPFEIRGACEGDADGDGRCDRFLSDSNPDAVTVLNAEKVEAGDTSCVVDIKTDSNYIRLRDIEITNVPATLNAVCINGKAAEFRHVKVGGGSVGFYIAADAMKTTIYSDCMVHFAQTGIDLENASDTANNIIMPSEEDIGMPDANGIALLPEGSRLVLSEISSAENWIVSKQPYKIYITKQTVTLQGNQVKDVIVKGYVGQGEEVCPSKAASGLQRIQIFSAGGKTLEGSATEDGALVGYVGQATGFGYNVLKGTFRVRFPAADYSRVILVPEIAGGGVGKASKIIYVTNKDDVGDCPDVKVAGEFGDDDLATGGQLIMNGLQHCCAVRDIDPMQCGQVNVGGGPAEGYDTDGDSIPDDSEDTNYNCICDGTESCFTEVDSDLDGIPDGVGKEKINLYADNDTVSNILDEDSDGDGKLDGQEDRNQHFKISTGTKQVKGLLWRFRDKTFSKRPLKVNGKPVECELSDDKGVGVSYQWYQVTCADAQCMQLADKPVEVGSWSSITSAPSETETEGEGEGEVTTNKTHYEMLVCRNKSLGNRKNFNGEFNKDNFETDPYNWDTDGDKYCDGDGSEAGCGWDACAANEDGEVTCTDNTTTVLDEVDNCPIIVDATNECQGVPLCYAEEIFYGVDESAVDWDSNGNPKGLLDTDGDNIPDAFEEEGVTRDRIWEVCPGDMDLDGIPDCVEQPFATCDTDGLADPKDPSTWGLKYYSADSDGDILKDAEDVCPEHYGANDQDKFDANKKPSDYSCEPYISVYASKAYRHVLSLFIDRDGDGLKDGEEDRNMDGKGFEGNDNTTGGITLEKLMTIETDPLNADSDNDGASDYQEVSNKVKDDAKTGEEIYTNPRNADTDGDGLVDGKGIFDKAGKLIKQGEDRDGIDGYDLVNLNLQGAEDCPGAATVDTDPTAKDTDDDKLEDGVELDGAMVVGDDFVAKILDDKVWEELGGIDVISNPRSKDSDGDGLADNEEYNGIVKYTDSNPCMRDSDSDTRDDKSEEPGCRLNKDDNCVGGENFTGKDKDSDGLVDSCEKKLGTDPNQKDTDGDGVMDGDEDVNHNCIYEPNLNETDPQNADTDGDGLSDGFELKYGTDPVNQDTDNDCLPDGMEDRNHNGQYDMGAETNALSSDTDGDGLPDGWLASSGLGEDVNCNGTRDMDGSGKYVETDPMNPDSDGDGKSDGQELGGIMANRSRALNREGCSIAGSATGAPTSMFYLMGMLIGAVRIISRRMKKASA